MNNLYQLGKVLTDSWADGFELNRINLKMAGNLHMSKALGTQRGNTLDCWSSGHHWHVKGGFIVLKHEMKSWLDYPGIHSDMVLSMLQVALTRKDAEPDVPSLKGIRRNCASGHYIERQVAK